jgi:hypothetical protein
VSFTADELVMPISKFDKLGLTERPLCLFGQNRDAACTQTLRCLKLNLEINFNREVTALQ